MPSGCFTQAFGFRLIDAAFLRMAKEGIPLSELSEHERIMNEIEREMEENERKLAAKKTKTNKEKPSSEVKKLKNPPSKKASSGS